MADKNIGTLPGADDIYDDSLFVVEHSGTAKSISGRQIKDYAKEGVETYVESAQKAAQDAVAAATQAETAVQDTQANKEAAQAAQRAAEAAEQGAEEARTAIENMLVEAVTKATGEPATVTKELVDGVVKLVFGLPAGAKGDKGDTGSSIQSISRTSGTGAPGTTDTYTITMTDGSTSTFTVYNGADGIGAGDFMANGSVPMSGNLQMGGNRLTGLGAPVEDGDAVRKVDLAGLTVTTDPTPTQGSTNPVQSGGVFEALAEESAALEAHKADKENPHKVTAEQVGAAPKDSPILTGSISLGRKPETTVGAGSYAVGHNVIASGNQTHAEGNATVASGEWCSHAEGYLSEATENYAHAEGRQTVAAGIASHAEGSQTSSTQNCAHAEGHLTKADGDSSHAEGESTVASGSDAHAEGNGTTASGSDAHAEGRSTIASGTWCSHAEGYLSEATENYAHAEGQMSKANGSASHAEGYQTIAAKNCAHAEGNTTKAEGENSHAEGDRTVAKGQCSHSAGSNTIANDYQYVIGTYNVEKLSTGTGDDRFIIGGGWSTRANAFRVHSNGTVYGGQYNSSGADYAELFEWADGNAAKEDRAGLFVTLEGENIRLAGPEEAYILGIVSADPSVVGDVYDDQWAGMYLRDVFGRTIMEEQDFPAEVSPDGEVIREARRELAPKLNPDYRPEEKYIPRTQRPEWDAVGMMGKLVAVDDGTCEPNGYCKVAEGGIATRSDTPTPYRVLSRLDDNHIRVLIR